MFTYSNITVCAFSNIGGMSCLSRIVLFHYPPFYIPSLAAEVYANLVQLSRV